MRTCCQFYAASAEAMMEFGRKLGSHLQANQVLCLRGDLGAGKTTLMKGLAPAIAGVSEHEVNSPTYTYLNIYEGAVSVYHFDLYRVGSADGFHEMGFDEYLHAGGVCCLEWPERIEELLPEDRIELEIAHSPQGGRDLTLMGIEL